MEWAGVVDKWELGQAVYTSHLYWQFCTHSWQCDCAVLLVCGCFTATMVYQESVPWARSYSRQSYWAGWLVYSVLCQTVLDRRRRARMLSCYARSLNVCLKGLSFGLPRFVGNWRRWFSSENETKSAKFCQTHYAALQEFLRMSVWQAMFRLLRNAFVDLEASFDGNVAECFSSLINGCSWARSA